MGDWLGGGGGDGAEFEELGDIGLAEEGFDWGGGVGDLFDDVCEEGVEGRGGGETARVVAFEEEFAAEIGADRVADIGDALVRTGGWFAGVVGEFVRAVGSGEFEFAPCDADEGPALFRVWADGDGLVGGDFGVLGARAFFRGEEPVLADFEALVVARAWFPADR